MTLLKEDGSLDVERTRKMSESERFAHMFKKSNGLVCKRPDIEVGLKAA